MAIRNFRKLSVFTAILLLLSTIAGCSDTGMKSEVNIKETTTGEAFSADGQAYSVDGRFYIFMLMDVVHPRFSDIENNMDETLKYGLAVEFVQHAVHIVIRRDNKIVFVAGDSINSTDCFFTYNKNTKYDNKQKKLSDAGIGFFIPNEYRNDDIRLVMTNVNNFGVSTTIVDGIKADKYTQPEDVWFEYSIKK